MKGMCNSIAGMRAIDLSCLLLAPIAAGFLMTYTSTSTAVLAIAAWNLAVWAPECYLLAQAQQASSALRYKCSFPPAPTLSLQVAVLNQQQ